MSDRGTAPGMQPPTPLCGILNVDKPSGMTSHDVVAAVRRTLRQQKVGHAGTLDPMATGVLLMCLGDATRLSEYLMASPKTYRAEIRLGVSTTTDDAQGRIVDEQPVTATCEEIETALRAFVGRIAQVPPAFSAIKRGGKRLYELARQGIAVNAPPRQVEVYALRLLECDLPRLCIEVRCGPGTYIRALARDLGHALGCGAHLTALRRTQSGGFSVDEALPLDALCEGLQSALHPMDAAVRDLPPVELDAEAARRLAQGQAVSSRGAGNRCAVRHGDLARAYAPGERFLAIVSWDGNAGAWRPRKVFIQPNQI